MSERRWLQDDEAHLLHEDMLARALPIRFAGPRRVDVGGMNLEVALVVLDASSRPDVKDLFRVVAVEGHQSTMKSAFRYLIRDGQGFMEIGVRLDDPVNCAFTFVLTWPAHQDLFALVLMHERLFFTTQDLNRESRASSLGVTITRAELEPILRMWRRLGSSGTMP